MGQVSEHKRQHRWEVSDLGLLDTVYKCSACGRVHMESADNPDTDLPMDQSCPHMHVTDRRDEWEEKLCIVEDLERFINDINHPGFTAFLFRRLPSWQVSYLRSRCKSA